MEKDVNKKVASGLGWSYSERLLSQMVSLVVSTVLARILDPEHYGVISVVMVFINILDALVIHGFGTALVQKKDADDLDFNTVCCFNVLIGVVLYVTLFFAAPFIARFYEMEQLTSVTRVMGIRVIIASFNSIQNAYVQKQMAFKRFFYSTLGGTLFSAVVGVVMALLGAGVWALVAQSTVNAFVNMVVLRFTIRWKPRLQFSLLRLKQLMRFGLQMLGASLVNVFQDNIRSLVIAKVFTSSDLAYYNQGKKYPSTFMASFMGSVQKVMLPAFVTQQTQEEKKKFMRSAARLSSFVLLPFITGIIAIADTFIILLLTEKWAMAIPYMRILSMIYLTRTMNSLFQSNLLAIGKSDLNMYHEILGSVLSLLLLFVGSFVLKSVLFIAWSYVIVMIIGTIFFVVCVTKYCDYSLKEIASDYIPYLLLSSVMAVAVYGIGRIGISEILLLPLQVIAGVVLYVGLALLLRVKEANICMGIIKRGIAKIRPHNKKKEDE